MTTSAGSWHNPFRTPAATPNATGVSSNPASSSTSNSAAISDPTGLTEEPPPAYTPGPDIHQGEETIEYGPQRPFQPPPPPPAHTPLRPHPPAVLQTQPHSQSTPSLWRQLTEHLTSQLTGANSNNTLSSHPTGSSSWSGYPGQQPLQPTSAGHSAAASTSHANLQVPQLPPRRASIASSSPTSPSSDFARDFYAAGSGPEPQHPAPSSPSSHAPPHGRPSSTPGPDDGRPTQTPMPGHPLLRDGKLLVYPKGYTCDKCHNIGFKYADPSHPCKKCWTKYAKPFQGPLAYAFTTDSSTTSTTSPTSPLSGSTFQRPLPSFQPPRQTVPQFRPSAPPPPPPPRPPRPPPQPAFNTHPHPPQILQTLSPYTAPPRNAVVYRSGDPRIGGRLCWRCDGRGSVSLLIFDSVTCDVCGGIGRVFT